MWQKKIVQLTLAQRVRGTDPPPPHTHTVENQHMNTVYFPHMPILTIVDPQTIYK